MASRPDTDGLRVYASNGELPIYGIMGSEVKWGVLKKNPIFSYVSDKITPHFTLVVINH